MDRLIIAAFMLISFMLGRLSDAPSPPSMYNVDPVIEILEFDVPMAEYVETYLG